MTNEELINVIKDAIDDLSDALRGLLEEAGRRLQEGRADEALRQSFRYGARIVAFIENEKLKRKIDEGAVIPPQTTIFPTQPGAYWYQPVGLAHVLLVEVRLTEGELTAWWADRPIAIAKLTGYWRGPIPLSTGPGSR